MSCKAWVVQDRRQSSRTVLCLTVALQFRARASVRLKWDQFSAENLVG